MNADGRWHWFTELGYGMDPEGNRVDSGEAYIEGVQAYVRGLEQAAARVPALERDVRFLLSFVPPWAKDVPEGLGPTFYGTLTAAGDREVKARVDAIVAALNPTAAGSEPARGGQG